MALVRVAVPGPRTPEYRLVLGSPIAIDQGTALSEFGDFNKITESEIVLHSGAIRLKIIDKF
ncbi:hypothetical protein [Microcoleus sp. herbarium14]|uniref:hypothetical protein n=1 Tax=Microcoleus sp. herbarium14 TaxID=3055439 RepID=UPI002FD1CF00